MEEYVLSLSYGKDSLACLGAIEQLGWPLDRIIHAEVWATDTIPADLPPMVEFKSKADKIIKDRWGIDVEHLCAARNGEKLTYEKLFYHVPKRKPGGKFRDSSGGGQFADSRTQSEHGVRNSKTGRILGFPIIKGNWCTSDLKRSCLRISSLGQKRELVCCPQNQGFPLAPLHKGLEKILCSISA